jgi:hypothetical protein
MVDVTDFKSEHSAIRFPFRGPSPTDTFPEFTIMGKIVVPRAGNR